MHKYEWDPVTGGILLLPQQEKSSKEPRPVYYREMNLLGMDKRWKYPQNDDAPIMWAEAEKYIYHGKVVARAKGGSLYSSPTISSIISLPVDSHVINSFPDDSPDHPYGSHPYIDVTKGYVSAPEDIILLS